MKRFEVVLLVIAVVVFWSAMFVAAHAQIPSPAKNIQSTVGLDRVHDRLSGIDRRLDGVDGRLVRVDERIDTLNDTVNRNHNELKELIIENFQKGNDLTVQVEQIERSFWVNFYEGWGTQLAMVLGGILMAIIFVGKNGIMKRLKILPRQRREDDHDG